MPSRFAALTKIQEESEQRQPHEVEATQTGTARVPRPVGKRQNPAYQQISAYVRRDLYDMVRRELIGKSEDFSDLLEQWMEQWKRSKKIDI
jgi:hypothetical protein